MGLFPIFLILEVYTIFRYLKAKEAFLLGEKASITFRCAVCKSEKTYDAAESMKIVRTSARSFGSGRNLPDIFARECKNLYLHFFCPTCNQKTWQHPLNVPLNPAQVVTYKKIKRRYFFLFFAVCILSVMAQMVVKVFL